MGQNASVGFAQDTITSEQFLSAQQSRHRFVQRAFQKCCSDDDDDASTADDRFDLSVTERNCITEYALLYASYANKTMSQFSNLYEQHQRDLMVKARTEYMRQQARQDLSKG